MTALERLKSGEKGNAGESKACVLFPSVLRACCINTNSEAERAVWGPVRSLLDASFSVTGLGPGYRG